MERQIRVTNEAINTAGSSDEVENSMEGLSDLTGSDLEEEDETWIEWFCNLKGNEAFVLIDEDFVRDDFNLTGLSAQVPYYSRALSLIVDGELSDESLSDTVSFSRVEKSAAFLFGLVHARFIITQKGLQLLHKKVTAGLYQKKCPNALCGFNYILPCAVTDAPNLHTVKLFCARCNELYHPPRESSLHSIDGAFFGTSVASMFFLTYPSLLPKQIKGASSPFPDAEHRESHQGVCHTTGSGVVGKAKEPEYYIPRIFGFKVHPNFAGIIAERVEEAKAMRAMLTERTESALAAARGNYQHLQQDEDEEWSDE